MQQLTFLLIFTADVLSFVYIHFCQLNDHHSLFFIHERLLTAHIRCQPISSRKTAGKSYSDINTSAIGVTGIETPPSIDNALKCTTDKVPCCRSLGDTSLIGEWYFPNHTLVPGQRSTDFFRSRGFEDGTVNLNRMSGATSPTGLFCCRLPDANDIEKTMCANIGE